jgi:hypothetical protein
MIVPSRLFWHKHSRYYLFLSKNPVSEISRTLISDLTIPEKRRGTIILKTWCGRSKPAFNSQSSAYNCKGSADAITVCGPFRAPLIGCAQWGERSDCLDEFFVEDDLDTYHSLAVEECEGRVIAVSVGVLGNHPTGVKHSPPLIA